MADHESPEGLWDELQESYDTYRYYSFLPDPPDRPLVDHWQKKSERLTRIWLNMPFLPVALLRVRDALVKRGVPLLPYFCEMLSIGLWRVSIGRHAVIGPGLIIPHGQVVIDGIVQIGRDCVINPWVTIGLSSSRSVGFTGHGPTIGDRVFIGSGAKLLGPITVGDNARIGANAVVIDDVPAGATTVGVPARVVHEAPPPSLASLTTNAG
ncbi:MAG: DapH/DapD/GlmU-related protein [Dehalococcoidia bacterium]